MATPDASQDSSPTAYLPDILAPGLDVIFVGAAASHNSARAGHWYAGPTNKFWLLLAQSGFTPRQLRPEEDIEVLQYGLGLTCVFPHSATSRSTPRETASVLSSLPLLQRERRLSDEHRPPLYRLGRTGGTDRRLAHLRRPQFQRSRGPLGSGPSCFVPGTSYAGLYEDGPHGTAIVSGRIGISGGRR